MKEKMNDLMNIYIDEFAKMYLRKMAEKTILKLEDLEKEFLEYEDIIDLTKDFISDVIRICDEENEKLNEKLDLIIQILRKEKI